MTIQMGVNLSGASGTPNRPENVEVPQVLFRAPTTQDKVNYPLGKFWLNIGDTIWVLVQQTTTNGVLQSNWKRLGSGEVIGINVPLGISPIIANAAGFITFTSNDGSVQITGSAADPLNNFIDFGVTGGQPFTKFMVDDTSGTGTNPVVPDATGLVTINGAVVAAGTHPLRTISTLPNQYQIQAQISQAIGSTDATKIGLSAFNDAQFTVDDNGYVSLNGSIPTVDLHTAKWIVNSTANAGGNQTTITAAMSAASAGDTIFVMPGSTGLYTENFTWKAGVNIAAFTCDALTPNVTIVGEITCSDAGKRTMSGICLNTNSGVFLNISGSAATVVNLTGCYLNCVNNNGISFTSSSADSALFLNNCQGNILTIGTTYFTSTSPGSIFIYFSRLRNDINSVTSSTSNAGQVLCAWSEINSPITLSGSAPIEGRNSIFATDNTTALVINNTTGGDANITHCVVSGLSASAITIGSGAVANVQHTNIVSSNTNAISGTGTLNYSTLDFSGSSSTINVTTQVPMAMASRILLSGGCQLLSGAGSPNGLVTAPQGSIWMRTDGSSTVSRGFINTDSGTTWTAIVTVA